MPPYRWDDDPSSAQTSVLSIPLFRVGKAGKAFIVPWQRFRGIWTHYGKFSFPCLREECELCQSQPARWKAYASGLAWVVDEQTHKQGWARRVLEITEAVRLLAGRSDLVGTVIELARLGKNKNGKLTWTVAPDHIQTQRRPEPQPFDFMRTLQKIWDEKGRHLAPVDPQQEEALTVAEDGEILKMAEPDAKPVESPITEDLRAQWEAAKNRVAAATMDPEKPKTAGRSR